MTKAEAVALFLITVLMFFAGFCAGKVASDRELREQIEFERTR